MRSLVFAVLFGLAGCALLPAQEPGSAWKPGQGWLGFQHDRTHSGRTPARGPKEGRVAWTFEADAAFSGPVIAADGTIYVASNDGRVYALGEAGELLWSHRLGAEAREAPTLQRLFTPALGNTRIYVTTRGSSGPGNGLHALSRDGSLLWKARIEGRVTSAPVIAPSGTVYLTAGGALHAVSPEGSVRWSAPLGASAMSTPAVEADGTVYAVGDGLVAVDPGGTVLWRMPLGASGLAGHPTIGPEGNILVASSDTLYSVAPSGSLRWSQSIGSSESSPAVDRFGRVYIGSTALGGEPQFRCVNGRNGGTLWSFPLRIASDSPPAVDAERRVFFGSDEGVFYAVDRYGLLLWHLELDEPPFRVQTRFPRDREDGSPDAHAHVDTPPAIGPAGRLVFALSRAAPPGGTYRLFVIAPAGR